MKIERKSNVNGKQKTLWCLLSLQYRKDTVSSSGVYTNVWWRWTAAAWWSCSGIERSGGCRRWCRRSGGPALEGIPPLWSWWVQAFRMPAGRMCTFVADQRTCPPSWWRRSLQRHQPSLMLDGGMSRRRCRWRWHPMWRSFFVAMEWGSARPVVFRRCATDLVQNGQRSVYDFVEFVMSYGSAGAPHNYLKNIIFCYPWYYAIWNCHWLVTFIKQSEYFVDWYNTIVIVFFMIAILYIIYVLILSDMFQFII